MPTTKYNSPIYRENALDDRQVVRYSKPHQHLSKFKLGRQAKALNPVMSVHFPDFQRV